MSFIAQYCRVPFGIGAYCLVSASNSPKTAFILPLIKQHVWLVAAAAGAGRRDRRWRRWPVALADRTGRRAKLCGVPPPTPPGRIKSRLRSKERSLCHRPSTVQRDQLLRRRHPILQNRSAPRETRQVYPIVHRSYTAAVVGQNDIAF